MPVGHEAAAIANKRLAKCKSRQGFVLCMSCPINICIQANKAIMHAKTNNYEYFLHPSTLPSLFFAVIFYITPPIRPLVHHFEDLPVLFWIHKGQQACQPEVHNMRQNIGADSVCSASKSRCAS